MPKPTEASVKSNLQFLRIFADREALASISKIARSEGRSQQRQIGIILENIARLQREKPEVIRDLGLFIPLTSIHSAAVA